MSAENDATRKRPFARAAFLALSVAFTGCHRAPEDPNIVTLQLAHSPMTTKDMRTVDLSLSEYEKVDVHRGQYRIVPGTTVKFSIPAKFLVSKWNLKGGPQASLFIETRADTRNPWEDCVDREHGAPKLVCPGQKGRLIVVNSALLPNLPEAFSPTRATFPDRMQLFSRMWKSRPGPRLNDYQVVFYDSWPSDMEAKDFILIDGFFNPYHDNFYMRPIDYSGKSVQIVDCNKIESFCKAYLFHKGFHVAFSVEKAELPRVTRVAADVRSLLDGFAR